MTPPSRMSTTTTGPPRGSDKHEHTSHERKRISHRQEDPSSKASVASSKSSTGGDGGEEVSKDIIWEQMFEELKAIKEKTGTCNLPDKKGRLAKWVYAQRKAFRRLQFSRGTATTRARLEKLESIGFEFSSSSYVAWDIMFEKYKKRDHGTISDDEARKLKLWMSNQRLEYSRQRRGLPNNITQERIAKLEAVGFQWVGRTGKPTSSTTEGEDNEGREDDVPKKRKRLEKSSVAPSKRCGQSSLRSCTTGDSHAVASSNRSKNGEVAGNQLREVPHEREYTMNEAGSLLHALAALKHGGATRPNSHVAHESLKKIVALNNGSNRHVARTDEIDDDDDDDESDAASDAPASDSSCSWCDKATTENCCNGENKNRPPKARSLRPGEKSQSAGQETRAERFFLDHKFSSANKTAELVQSSTAPSVITNSNSKSDNSNNIHRATDWPTTASLNSAPSANASFSGDSRGLSNNGEPFMHLQGAALSSIASGGGMFVPDYLSSAADVLQQQLRQQASAPLTSHDLMALLPFIGGGRPAAFPPSVHNALLSGYPYTGTFPQAASDDPGLGEFYHPSIAHFIYQR